MQQEAEERHSRELLGLAVPLITPPGVTVVLAAAAAAIMAAVVQRVPIVAQARVVAVHHGPVHLQIHLSNQVSKPV